MLKFKIAAMLIASLVLISSFSFAGDSAEYLSNGYACEFSQQRINYDVVTTPVIKINGKNLERITDQSVTRPYTLAEIERYAAVINSER